MIDYCCPLTLKALRVHPGGRPGTRVEPAFAGLKLGWSGTWRLVPGGCVNPARSGFTLIELVITVAIVAILALGLLPLTQLAAQRAKEGELRAALRDIRTAIDAYKKAADENRIEKKADQSGYPPELEVLAGGVKDIKTPDGKMIYFLRRIPRDPFFEDITVPAAKTWGLRSYESPPDDPHEGDDVFDVYSQSERVGLNGVPYKEW